MKEKYIDLSIECAKKAYLENEVPIGAVIVKKDKIISSAYNKKEKNGCVLEHAELIAIKEASKKLKSWRLTNCDIYVSLDPCPMCASAIKQARIKNVYSALNNSDENNLKIIKEIFKIDLLSTTVVKKLFGVESK